MLGLLQNLFADGLFIPHGHCYLWQPRLVWLHLLSDSLIAAAYFSIPVTLLYFVRKRQDLPFKWVLLLFGAFIISCGTTHIMEIWTLWHPTYWLSGLIKAVTAFISVSTAIALIPVIPQALALPSPAQLEAANSQLKQALNELANTQAQLIQTEQISALGQLVAGVAYEINNPINFIYGNSTLANEYAESLLNLIKLYQKSYPQPVPEIQAETEEIDFDFIQEDLPKILNSMKLGADRIRNLLLSLRNFSRLDEADKKPVDIHEGIDSTLLILQHRLKGKADSPEIQVIKEYGKLPKIECYPKQINQVFMNIFAHTIDVLRMSMVKLQETDRKNSQIHICTEVAEDNQVRICITDNSYGITDRVKQKIFEPFLSNPIIDSGTSIRLSISYQIIEKHGGKLHCISEPLQGTTFLIQIPIKMSSDF